MRGKAEEAAQGFSGAVKTMTWEMLVQLAGMERF